jgi:branched-chain amino acid aminotransferase
MLPLDDRDGVIWLNGTLVPWREAKVHVCAHSLHYGNAVFEGERAYGGKVFRGTDHSHRLHASAKLTSLTLPYSVEELDAAKAAVLAGNKFTDAYVRMIAWRGPEALGVSAAGTRTHVAVITWEWPSYYGGGSIRLKTSKWKRPSPETIPSAAKAAGLYMICTMSKHAAEAKGCSDAMMFDYRGYVAEATGANIFFVKNGEVHTPLPDCFLNGLTRQTVIGMLRDKQIKVHERHIMPEELESFEQCWLTGTAAEVTPVGQIGDYRFEVGALTRQVAEEYERLVRA